jgi:hypothetical protein
VPAPAPAPTETSAPTVVDTTILSADIASAQTLLTNAVVGTDTGDYAQTDVDALQSAITSAQAVESNQSSAQSDINTADTALNTAVSTFQAISQFVKVDYETPAPVITEQNTDTGKLVTVSAPAGSEDSSCGSASPVGTCLTDVLASTKIPKIFKVGEESKIHIKWKNNGNQNVTFQAYDTDNDGYLDYVEWTVPHLSDQIFEIIFISKSFQLDQDQNIIADIYDTVATQDGNYATVPDGNYVRVTFYQILDNTKDITIYAKPTDPNSSASIKVYPAYTDSDGNVTEGNQLSLVSDGQNPDFSNIDHDGKYRILLKNLQTPTDQFDLKITGNVDIDYIVDPTFGDSFSAETYIAGGLGLEFLTSSGWTSAGWTGGSWPVGFTHTTGNTTALSQSTAATVGAYYQIKTTVSGTMGTGYTVAFGGQTETTITTAGTYYWNIQATTTGNLTITPGSTFAGIITTTIFPINETTQVVGVSSTAPFGGITLAPCYVPTPAWTFVATTYVRDLSANSTTYIYKDIYCDSTNCILWTNNYTAPGTVCIATDTHVYDNILWAKTDAGTKAWASGTYLTNSIAGGDIGGAMPTNTAGSGSTSIGGYNWLERYYTSPVGSYPAMDACKALGLGWRLPTILELDSIRDQSPAAGTIYSRLPNIVPSTYWSSSEYSATYAWVLSFNNGTASNFAKSSAVYVRCVRGY